jgi:hypothetical protein
VDLSATDGDAGLGFELVACAEATGLRDIRLAMSHVQYAIFISVSLRLEA